MVVFEAVDSGFFDSVDSDWHADSNKAKKDILIKFTVGPIVERRLIR